VSAVVSIGVGDASGIVVPSPHGERPTREH
jgi:hypothetical protein